MADWLKISDPTIKLVKLPVIHSEVLAGLTKPLGVVMHTTNPGKTCESPGKLLSLEESRNDLGVSGILCAGTG